MPTFKNSILLNFLHSKTVPGFHVFSTHVALSVLFKIQKPMVTAGETNGRWGPSTCKFASLHRTLCLSLTSCTPASLLLRCTCLSAFRSDRKEQVDSPAPECNSSIRPLSGEELGELIMRVRHAGGSFAELKLGGRQDQQVWNLRLPPPNKKNRGGGWHGGFGSNTCLLLLVCVNTGPSGVSEAVLTCWEACVHGKKTKC